MSINNVIGFKVKQTMDEDKTIINQNSWIRIIKNKNELAKVELTTYVVYLRNNGGSIDSGLNGLNDNDHNYAFYSPFLTGSIYGFPLFDIDSDTWDLFNSKFNKDLLYRGEYTESEWNSLANKLVVLDFTNMPDVEKTELKYLIVRLKSSKEEKLHDFTNVDDVQKCCSLVKYTFTADIINPYNCIEINSNFLIYRELISEVGRRRFFKYFLAGGEDINSRWLRFPFNNKNSYTNFIVDVYSNTNGPLLQKGEWINLPNISDRGSQMEKHEQYVNIMKNLRNPGFPYDSTLSPSASNTLDEVWHENVSLIGEIESDQKPYDSEGWVYCMIHILWCSLNSPRHFKILPINLPPQYSIRYIQNIVDIENDGNCKGGGFPSSRTGEFKLGGNIEIPSKKNTIFLPRVTDKPYYYKTELSDGNIINKNTGEWELNKKINQYASIDEYSSSDDEFTDTFPNNHFKVYFKLLYSPENDDESNALKITYKFGKNINSKVTFYRYSDMDGICSPQSELVDLSGNIIENHKYADRNQETITLKWTKSDFTNNTEKKKIIIFDVASGESEHKITNNINVAPYNLLIDKNNSKYTIKSNVFQIRILNINGGGSIDFIPAGSGIPFTEKIFNTDEDISVLSYQYKYTTFPINYIPFRYINTVQDNRMIISSKDGNPLRISNKEEYFYFVSKKMLSEKNANIIKEYASINLVEDILSFPKETNGNTFSILPYRGNNPINRGNTIIFTVPELPGKLKFDIIRNKVNNVLQDNVFNGYRRKYPLPYATNVKNKFITDYWQWIDQISFSAKRLNLSEIELDILRREIENNINNYVNFREFSQLFQTYINNIPGEDLKNFNFLKNDEEVVTLDRIEEEINIKTYKYFNKQSEISTIANLYAIFYESSLSQQIKYILVNTYNNVSDISYMDKNGNIVTEPRFRVTGTDSLQESLDKRPIILSVTGGGVSIFNSGIYYIGNDGTVDPSKGLNKPLVDFTFDNIFTSNKSEIQNTNQYNSTYSIFISGARLISQNQPLSGVNVLPYPIRLNLVEINRAKQFWPRKNINNEEIQEYQEMVMNDSKGIIIEWEYYKQVDKTEGNIYWLIKKKNLVTLEEIIINEEYGGLSVKKLTDNEGNQVINFSNDEKQRLTVNNDNNTYLFIDRDVRVYDKYQYTIEGIFKWDTLKINKVFVNKPLSINIEGFTTLPIFLCKNNRFEYGRFNTTSTNLKLFKPLIKQQNCSEVNYNITRQIQTNNNIYNSTSDQRTKKQIFNYLSKSKFRPFR